MARVVDADKLSEKITTEYCGKCGIYNGELCCSCPMNDALNYIEDAPTADVAPKAEWISVEERLPLNFESVLVLATSRREDSGYDVLIAYHDRGEWEERCVNGDGGTVYAHVKYWMPLPKPPVTKGE